MSTPSQNNASNLSNTLRQSLQEVLREVSFDNHRLMGSSFDAAPTRNPLLQQGLSRWSSFNIPSFASTGSIAPSNTSSSLQAALGSVFSPSDMASGSFGGASTSSNSTGAVSSSGMRPSEVLGMTTEELLLAAATEKRMLEATQRVVMSRQQTLAEKTLESRRLYNESLLALMKGRAASAPMGQHPSINNAGLVGIMTGASTSGLLQQGLLQQLSKKQPSPALQVAHNFTAAAVPALADAESKTAIKVLGTSLRKKDSPYLDVSRLQDPDVSDKRTRGGVTEPFPEKLHRMLEEVKSEGKEDVISFFSHGRAFAVHDPERFTSEVMPKYFKQSRLSSFQRQLNLYGFTRITSGPDAGGYYHELFLQGRPNLAVHMRRVGLPQGEDRRKMRAKNLRSEPNFYALGPVKDAKVNIPGL